jgi:tRNA(fMet)-specific endonuclease VapC
MAVLDTSLLVDLLRRRSKKHGDAQAKIAGLVARGDMLFTTIFCVAELAVGIELSDNPSRDRAEMEKLLAGISVLDFQAMAAETFAAFRAQQQRSGLWVGDMDTLIAATSVTHGETLLVTRNPRHFANFPGLAIESY